ncbi:MAG: hypothetical protein E7043_10315 [Lentisphaerae bacterium]|nr:hypothetical protein [Lentisphaerota bacterium]
MKFQVGYQSNRKFVEYLLKHGDMVSELYFPWGEFTTGRGVTADTEQLAEDLKCFKQAGFRFCLLLNGNCYGSEALSVKFFDKLGNAIMEVMSSFGLNSVTTASPVIAAFLKQHFPDLHIRASVNMEIGTPEGVEYLLDDFDSFYLKREYNYDLAVLTRMYDICHKNGKKLYILANSGCLNFCSARTFHDNLVAHQHEIAQMDNAVTFHGVCTKFLSAGKNKENILAKSNFIRPEDIHYYEELCDGMKLATRTNFNPMAIAYAYFNGKFSGNLLDLTEPAHSALFPGEIIANNLIPEEYFPYRFSCDKICENCDYCKNIQKNATVKL